MARIPGTAFAYAMNNAAALVSRYSRAFAGFAAPRWLPDFHQHLLRMARSLTEDGMDNGIGPAPAGEFVLRSSDHMVLCGQFCLRDGIRQAALLQGPSISVELNETAAEILKRCEGPCSVANIVDDLKALYVGATSEEIERAVREFLECAYRKGWVRRTLAADS